MCFFCSLILFYVKRLIMRSESVVLPIKHLWGDNTAYRSNASNHTAVESPLQLMCVIFVHNQHQPQHLHLLQCQNQKRNTPSLYKSNHLRKSKTGNFLTLFLYIWTTEPSTMLGTRSVQVTVLCVPFYVFSLCLYGFPLGFTVSSQLPKTWQQVDMLNWS